MLRLKANKTSLRVQEGGAVRDKPVRDLAALFLLLTFSAGADGLMEWLGLTGFAVAGLVVLALAWVLTARRTREK